MENVKIENMEHFQPHKVLDHDVLQKKLVISGKLNYGRNAIITLTRKGFPVDISKLKEIIFNEETAVEHKYCNGNERHYELTLTNETNVLHATIKHPVKARDFAQYNIPEFWFIEETPELYGNVTRPNVIRIKSNQKLNWIDSILNGEAEQEQILHIDKDESTGYVLVKDSKWQSEELSEMHIVAFTKQKLMTIRELNETHLPLLKKIKQEGTEIITEKYPNISAEQLRIYILYLPSVYHLHVHFTSDTAENADVLLDRIHFLSTVINNIELMPDYYQKATLGLRFCVEKVYNPYREYLEKKKAEIGPITKKRRISNKRN